MLEGWHALKLTTAKLTIVPWMMQPTNPMQCTQLLNNSSHTYCACGHYCTLYRSDTKY
jgi:hypothetical protein